NDPGTRLEPRINKESPEVEITVVVQPINVNEEEEESIEDDYELKRWEKGKHVEESRLTPSPTTVRSPRIHYTIISLDTGENDTKRQKTSEHETYGSGESSSGQVNKSKPGPSTSGNQEQLDDFDFWMDSYTTDDDKIPIEKVS
nr:hypothetical protein [Tanacetum cinerariifolium]